MLNTKGVDLPEDGGFKGSAVLLPWLPRIIVAPADDTFCVEPNVRKVLNGNITSVTSIIVSGPRKIFYNL